VDDMMINNNLGGLPIQIIVNRDRWQETEADSGSSFNDTILGQDGVLANPRLVGGAGFTGCDALDQAGVNRIQGLAALLPPVAQWQGTAAETASLSATGVCPLTGPVWGEGDILLGGPGSDTITGRAGDEIIDGDKELRVAISVTDGQGNELGRTDLMENRATSGNFGPGTTGMTLQQAVFAGLVDPGNLVNIREIRNAVTAAADCGSASPVNCDTAVFAGPRSQYTITTNAQGAIVVTDTTSAPVAAGVAAVGDGSDTLTNIEQLRFADQTVSVAPRVQLSASSLAFGNQALGTTSATQNITVSNAGIAALKVTNVTVTGTDPGQFTATPAAGCASIAGGGSCNVAVRFAPTSTGSKSATINIVDNAAGSPHSVAVTGTGAALAPGAPVIGTAVRGNASATVNWTAPSNGGSAITGYSVRVVNAAGAQVGALRPAGAAATSLVVTGLTNGTTYRFQVRATNAIGTGPFSALSNAVTPATVPGAPLIGTASSGAAGGAVNATARWSAPAVTGGSAITGYRVTALRLSNAADTTPNATVVSAVQGAAVRALTMTLPAGLYRFTVQAINAVGGSAQSARSNLVTAR
jgi:hypothetical protein